jgi:2-dehydro-3-deoxy-L-rhamnonate dehydrogenase (NAD+)
VAQVERQLGPIDILVNAAGVWEGPPSSADITDDDWRRIMRVNAHGAFYVARAMMRVMASRGWGRIVFIASIAGKEGFGTAAYSASKGAVIAAAKALARELAANGVLVHAVAPGLIETDAVRGTLSDRQWEALRQRSPMGRAGRAEEVAALVSYLAGEDHTFSTGMTYDISGGRATW